MVPNQLSKEFAANQPTISKNSSSAQTAEESAALDQSPVESGTLVLHNPQSAPDNLDASAKHAADTIDASV